MFFLYQIIISIIILLSPLIIFIRILKNKEDIKRFKEKFCLFSKKKVTGKLIWFHGASVGELLSLIPIIYKLEKNTSIKQILVTTNTLSSSKVFKKYRFKKTIHQFFPIDHSFLTNKFLKYWKPHVSIFVDSEVWPSMTLALKKKNIPLILLNARITKKSYKRWLKFSNFAKYIFSKIKIAYPQNKETKKYLKNFNVKKLKELGNLKLIENTKDKKDNISDNLNSQFKKYCIWTAASTHKNEEIFCANVHIQLKKRIPNLLTIIIPRHIDRVDEIIAQMQSYNLKITTHSSKLKSLNKVDIYIVDTFGETKKFFRISNSVFMGGTIAKKGGQNPLEAARYGSKIFHGPDIKNFPDIFRLLKNLNISKEIRSPKQLASLISFNKKTLGGIKLKKIGRLIQEKTLKELKPFINNEP
jgi:3-deoxy-D-manno-octulosonic-acid transferase